MDSEKREPDDLMILAAAGIAAKSDQPVRDVAKFVYAIYLMKVLAPVLFGVLFFGSAAILSLGNWYEWKCRPYRMYKSDKVLVRELNDELITYDKTDSSLSRERFLEASILAKVDSVEEAEDWLLAHGYKCRTFRVDTENYSEFSSDPRTFFVKGEIATKSSPHIGAQTPMKGEYDWFHESKVEIRIDGRPTHFEYTDDNSPINFNRFERADIKPFWVAWPYNVQEEIQILRGLRLREGDDPNTTLTHSESDDQFH